MGTEVTDQVPPSASVRCDALMLMDELLQIIPPPVITGTSGGAVDTSTLTVSDPEGQPVKVVGPELEYHTNS